MLEIRPYIPSDYIDIKRRHFDALAALNFPKPWAMARNLATGRAFTMTYGEIVACGGILPLWKRVGEGWLVTSKLADQHKIALGKAAWRIIAQLFVEMDLERLQTMVDAEHSVSLYWLERMGFKPEGRMPKYMGGRDFIRLALVR